MPKPHQGKRKVLRWTKRILLIAGALGILFVLVRALLPERVAADVVTVSRGPLEVEVREDGQTRVRERYIVAAPISGELERITLDTGSSVERGAVVASIQPSEPALLDDRARSETAARLSAAQARARKAATAVARARESNDYAALEAKRKQALHAGGAISAADRDRAEMAARIAEEDVAAAEHEQAAVAAEVTALRAVLEPRRESDARARVTAPARGRVLRILRESAGPVAAGTTLLEVGDPASLEVVVDVLSRDAERIAPGMPVYLDTASARPARGAVTRVEPSAFTRVSALGIEEQRVNVIVRLDGASTLGDAFRVDARIVLWRGENVLRIPSGALFRDHGAWAVYVVAEGRAHLEHVEVGHRGRTDVEIVNGLRVGDRVIVHPSDQIHDDRRVAERM